MNFVKISLNETSMLCDVGGAFRLNTDNANKTRVRDEMMVVKTHQNCYNLFVVVVDESISVG